MLDPKERKIHIELTQFGKEQLAAGVFNPEFYALCDDEVLYDSNYGGFAENQNDASTRIKEETPYLAPFTSRPIETNLRRKISNNTLALSSLGHAIVGEQKMPAWRVRSLISDVTLSGSSQWYTGSTYEMRPQLHFNNIQYDIVVKATEVDMDLQDLPVADTYAFYDLPIDGGEVFSDGTYLSIVPDKFLLGIDEINTALQNDNFEMEVFIETNQASSSLLQPLYFRSSENEDLTPNHVEYYLDISLDADIDNDILCLIKEDDRREDNLWLDNIIEECRPSRRAPSIQGIYGIEVERKIQICEDE